jgi:hypothetical protein
MNGRRFIKGLEIAAGVAGILAVVIAVITYVFPRGPAQPQLSPAATQTPSAPPADSGGRTPPAAPPPTSASTRPPSGGTLLTALTPTAGGAYVSVRSAAGRLVLPCPTDSTQNDPRTVTYEIRGQFHRFTTTVQVTGAPAIAGRTTLEVLAGDQRAGRFDKNGNGSGSLDAALSVPNQSGGADPVYAQHLSLRLTCELTGPTVTLSSPTLVPVG